MRRDEWCTTRCGHTRHWAAKSNFTAYGCDVDFLSEICTKLGPVMLEYYMSTLNVEALFVDNVSTGCTNA